MLNFSVNEELCIKCGLCAQDCIAGVIALDEFPKISNEGGCIKCQHCLAVCPTGALSILGNSPEDSTEIKGKMPDAEQMEILIKGRRSVRKYKPEALEPELIQKLMDIAWHAPTGVNSQSVTVTLMEDPEQVKAFSEEVYRRIEDGVKNGTLPQTPISHYFQWAIESRKHGGDMIFRGAPHFIIVSGSKSAPCPVVDAHIFLSYFELMAQTMKIGTLWNGFLKYSVDVLFPDLKEKLGIPADHELGHAMVFGKPAVKYQRTVERGHANIRRVEWKG
ncbi:nitroreductase family protein [Maridesulfovibrio sp. FT414]|uniref:nitroreductase family protein n=1 Tax=Maridesulfovibrio sp. FT414 TaxID=2979469 RepID=UPI003D8043EC